MDLLSNLYVAYNKKYASAPLQVQLAFLLVGACHGFFQNILFKS
jgi:hypothetical protein